jgi:hypothetical protein
MDKKKLNFLFSLYWQGRADSVHGKSRINCTEQ